MAVSSTRLRYHLLALFLFSTTSLTGCATVPQGKPGGSDARALALLHESAIAQGSEQLAHLHDVNVHYKGQWLSFISKVQPVLVDNHFRGSSEERLMVHEQVVGQAHHASGGGKQVFRKPGLVRVGYNGVESKDKDVLDASALVADAYRMFLFGPAFFLERGATVQTLGREYVDERECDNLLAILRPGVGNDAEDRVIISIDRKERLVRRVRMTVDGMESTRGAVADIFLRDYLRVGGVWWPTSFYEELKRPFDIPVHQWRLVGIDVNRGISEEMLGSPNFAGAAVPDAGSELQK